MNVYIYRNNYNLITKLSNFNFKVELVDLNGQKSKELNRDNYIHINSNSTIGREFISNFSKAYSKLYPIEPVANVFDQLKMIRTPGNKASLNSSNSSSEYTLVDPNKIHLFVKAGQDGSSFYFILFNITKKSFSLRINLIFHKLSFLLRFFKISI